MDAELLQMLAQQASGFRPKRADSFFAAFAV
jgi:hypothetical protein